jgi:hypothetical protein
MLGVPVAYNEDQAVAVRALVRLAPAAGLVGRCSDGAVALVGSPFNLKPAFAALTSTDRVVVDCGVETEMAALDPITPAGKRCADLVVVGDLFRFRREVLCWSVKWGLVTEQKNPARDRDTQ